MLNIHVYLYKEGIPNGLCCFLFRVKRWVYIQLFVVSSLISLYSFVGASWLAQPNIYVVCVYRISEILLNTIGVKWSKCDLLHVKMATLYLYVNLIYFTFGSWECHTKSDTADKLLYILVSNIIYLFHYSESQIKINPLDRTNYSTHNHTSHQIWSERRLGQTSIHYMKLTFSHS